MAAFTPDHGSCHSDNNPEPCYGETLLKSGEFSDITIRTATRTIKAHKCILARLPYFKKTINFNTANFGSCNQIDMSDDDESNIDLLLKYLYTQVDKCCWSHDLSELAPGFEMTYDNILGLLATADKYGADRLVENCLGSLDTNMSMDLQTWSGYVMEKESAANSVDRNADELGTEDKAEGIIYESVENCEDDAIRQAIIPVLDIIDRVYQRDATDVDRRIRKSFLNLRMEHHVTRYLWGLEEVQEMLQDPGSELGYEVLSALARTGHEARACQRVNDRWNGWGHSVPAW